MWMTTVTAWLSICAAPLPAAAPQDFVRIGWQDTFKTDRGWQPEPWAVSKPDEHHRKQFDGGAATFEVATAGRAMAWTLTTVPIWVEHFPLLEVSYTIDQTDAEVTLLLGDDSTGPITPGALNPENPLASGSEVRVQLPADQRLLHLDLLPQLKTDRIARVTLLVRSQGHPVRVSLHHLAFRSPELATPPTAPLLPVEDKTAAESAGQWQPLALPAQGAISAAALAQALETAPTWPEERAIQRAGIPFQLGEGSQAALATGVHETANLQIEGQWRGRRLALLLASRCYGSAGPWFGAKSTHPREVIRSPHELAVHLEYEDGTRDVLMPRNAVTGQHAVGRSPTAYLVPLQPDKALTRISLAERMSYGQIFLLAASLDRSPAESAPPPPAASSPPILQAPPAPGVVRIDQERDLIKLRTSWLQANFDVSNAATLRDLTILPTQRQVISGNATRPFVEILDSKKQPLSWVAKYEDINIDGTNNRIELAWSVQADRPLNVKLSIAAPDTGELRAFLSITNPGDTPWEGSVNLAGMGPCRIADQPRDRGYLLGSKTSVLSYENIEIEKPYGGGFPLQLMDLYDRQGTAGLGLLVEDLHTTPKHFRFRQDAAGAHWSVLFPRVRVQPQSRTDFPAVLLFAHLGDWHAAFERCRTEVRKAATGGIDKHMPDLFYCRRDYPLGGTGYLFDALHRQYTPQQLITESIQGFGGIDLIDISGWAYHEATGRVGDYRTNDLGGLAELRRATQAAHESKTRVGLYFEGYLIDRRAQLAAKGLPHWQLINRDGKPCWWPGDMEFFTCPGVQAWRDELSAMIADVAADTGADAVYVDEFGFCDEGKMCWSPDHGHPVPSNPMVEESRMLAAIRKSLDVRTPNVGIYVEQMPCDAMMGLIDGAFNYGMAWGGPGQHPTKLPLHRYVYPEIASIEMVGYGIRPIPLTEDDLHLCIFHGVAVWLKGRSESWYETGFRDLARRAYPILHDHAATFRSPDCTPLLPTLAENVYANRFVGRDEIILTVYNAGYATARGDLLTTSLPRGWRVRDLWSNAWVEAAQQGERIVLNATIEPRSVTVYALLAPTAMAR